MPRLPAIAAAIGTAVRFGRAAPPQIHAELKLEEEEEEEEGEAAVLEASAAPTAASASAAAAADEVAEPPGTEPAEGGATAAGGMFDTWALGLSAPGDADYQKSFDQIGLGRSHKRGEDPPLVFALVDERVKLPNRRAVTQHAAAELAAAEAAEQALLARLGEEQPLMPNKLADKKAKAAREKLKTPSQLQLERRARIAKAGADAQREFEEDKLAEYVNECHTMNPFLYCTPCHPFYFSILMCLLMGFIPLFSGTLCACRHAPRSTLAWMGPFSGHSTTRNGRPGAATPTLGGVRGAWKRVGRRAGSLPSWVSGS